MAATGITFATNGGVLSIDFPWRLRLMTLCSGIRVPLVGVAGVAVAPSHLVPRTGLRWGGAALGALRTGSYGVQPKRDFWLVFGDEELLVFQMHPGQVYRRIVLEVPEPRAEALRLRTVLGTFTGPFVR